MYWHRWVAGAANFRAEDLGGGGKNVGREFRGGQILSARDFQICTAPPPAVNNDCSLRSKNVLCETLKIES